MISSTAPHPLSFPQSGWEIFLTKIDALGIYDLPGEPDVVANRDAIKDGIAAVVEIKTSDSYRAYLYMGLQYYKEQEVKKIEEIIDLLSSEFQINMY